MFAGSEEKNAEPATDLSSTSMPACAAARLTMACVFWRGLLMDVWKTSLSRTPSRARMPSAPLRHPAASSVCAALSTLNSQAAFGERKRAGSLT